MIRSIAMLATATLALLFTVSSAQAVDFYFVPSGTTNVGDSVTLELRVDTEAEDLQAWFLVVNHVGNVATSVAQEPFIFAGGQLASPLGAPIANSIGGGTGSGQWAFVIQPPNAFPPGNDVKYGEISFSNLAAGDITIAVAPGGAVGGLNGLDLVAAGLVTFETITVPEPSVALMGALSIGVIGVLRRRAPAAHRS